MSDIEVIMNRELTERDKALMNAIADAQEQNAVRPFGISHFELAYTEENEPAVRAVIKIRVPNRILMKAPAFASNQSIQENVQTLIEVLADTSSVRNQLPTRRRPAIKAKPAPLATASADSAKSSY